MWSLWILERAFVHDFALKTSPFFPKVRNNQRARLWTLLHIEYMSLLDWTGVGMCGLGLYPCEVLYVIIRVLRWTKHEIGGDVWNIYIEYVCVCICVCVYICTHTCIKHFFADFLNDSQGTWLYLKQKSPAENCHYQITREEKSPLG